MMTSSNGNVFRVTGPLCGEFTGPGEFPTQRPVRLRLRDKFIQHNMTLYRCMISDIHDSSYVLFRTNLISNTSLHVGRPLLRPCLVAYAEATLARQKDSATNEKC